MTSHSKDRKKVSVFIHVIDVCLQLTLSRGLQELKGWGLDEIDLRIYFQYKKKKRKVKNKESFLPERSRLFKCLTDYTSNMMIPARTGSSSKRVLNSRRDQKYFFELIFLVESTRRCC